VLRIHVPPLRERHGDIPLLVDSFLEVFNRRYNRQVRRVTPEALRLLVAYHWPGNVRELRNVLERLVIETAGDAIGANALVRWMEEREYFQPGEWNAERVYEPRAPIVPEPRAGTPAWPAATDPPRVGDVFWGGRPVLRPMLGAAPEWPAEIVELEPGRPAPAPAPPPAEVDIDAPAIHRAYREARGNLTRAAAILGVHKATLYRHMKRLGIDRDELARAAAAEGEGAP
jgi:DNA-binding NtrC family response regulator